MRQIVGVGKRPTYPKMVTNLPTLHRLLHTSYILSHVSYIFLKCFIWLFQFIFLSFKIAEDVPNGWRSDKILTVCFIYISDIYLYFSVLCHTFQMAEDGEKLWHFQQTLTFLCPEEIPRSHSSQIIVFLWTFCFNLRQVAAFLQRSPLSARFNTGFIFMWKEKFYPVIKEWSLKSQSVEKV